MAELDLPKYIELRVPDRHIKHLMDWSVLPAESRATGEARFTMMITWISSFEKGAVEDLILEGHNRIEVQVDGQPTLVYTAPSWFTQPIQRAKVEWKRRQQR